MLGLEAEVWSAASLDRMSSKPALTMLPWGTAHPYLKPTASPLCLCFLLFLISPLAPPFSLSQNFCWWQGNTDCS